MLDWTFEKTADDVLYTAETACAVFRMDQPEYGSFTYETASGLKACSLFAQFGDFSESLALRSRRKPHVSENGEELSLDTENPIPFGAEPKVTRTFRCDESTLAVSTTFSMRHSFKMQSIFAGGLAFSGAISKFAIQSVPEQAGVIDNTPAWQALSDTAEEAVLFDSAIPPLRLITAAADGSALTFELGEDIWRWINAKRISGTSRYTITQKEGKLVFAWQLYTFTPENEETPMPDGRDWRLHYRLLAGTAVPETVKTADCKAVFDLCKAKVQSSALLSDGSKTICFSAAPALNVFKKWVRQQFAEAQEGDVFGLKVCGDHLCLNAAHMDRAKLKELPHWDAPAIAEAIRWADRQLAKYGARLVPVQEA